MNFDVAVGCAVTAANTHSKTLFHHVPWWMFAAVTAQPRLTKPNFWFLGKNITFSGIYQHYFNSLGHIPVVQVLLEPREARFSMKVRHRNSHDVYLDRYLASQNHLYGQTVVKAYIMCIASSSARA